MTGSNSDHFEMRRLESLSNTIFGVAMTLLAYDLPKAGFDNLPGWADLYRLYGGRLLGLVLSFIIAGIFWFSHQRRLSLQPYGSRIVVFGNLLFLLAIILLPTINKIYGNDRLSSAAAALYGTHLTVIATFNAGLWWLINRDGRYRSEFIRSALPILVFLPGTLVALIAPELAQYVWCIAFLAIFADRLFPSSPRNSS